MKKANLIQCLVPILLTCTVLAYTCKYPLYDMNKSLNTDAGQQNETIFVYPYDSDASEESLFDFDFDLKTSAFFSNKSYTQSCGYYTIYNLEKSRTYGAVQKEATIFYEAFTGIRLNVNDTNVSITPYRHKACYQKVYKIVIRHHDTQANYTELMTISDPAWDETINVDFSDYPNGLFEILFYASGSESAQCPGYIFKDSSGIYTACAVPNQYAATLEDDLALFDIWTKDLNPSDYLSLQELTYPTAGLVGNVVNVSEIAKFSHTLIKNDSWTDEVKVFSFVNWLSNNIAYDKWRTDVNGGHSRAWSQNNHNDPNLFAWTNHVGVCWDYTNMLAIMCRENGIPATSMDTETHTWNLVYLNGNWVSIDVCDTGYYDSWSEDGGQYGWVNNSQHSYQYYGLPKTKNLHKVISTNDQIWTTERATIK